MTDSHTHTHMLLINLSLVNSSFDSTLKESLWETLAPKKETTTAVFYIVPSNRRGKTSIPLGYEINRQDFK